MYYYEVVLQRSSAPKLTYRSAEKLSVGSIVDVPLKSTLKKAMIIEEVAKPETFDADEIESVSEFYYSEKQMETARFIAEYYFSSLGEALSLFVPYRRLEPHSPDSTSGTMQEHKESDNGVGVGALRPVLTPDQQKTYGQLLQKDRVLLFGVTGSGKTEIFITLMATMLDEGKSSVFLMPEISLTPQMEKRLKVYFGDQVAMWHSKLTRKKKEQILEGIYSGEVRIVAGARSSLFVPLKNLGLIIVDEEHDDSYKAMTRPRYHARDVAVLMGEKLGAKVVLASATPSVASWYKYDVVKLSKPYIETVKKYRFVGGTSLTPEMIGEIRNNFEAGNQGLVFLPTRGNFKYLYCESCGKTHLCPFCSVGMALHRYHRHLKCHYCGYTEAIVDTCGYCGHHPLKSERMGTVEAIEMIEEQIPDIRIEQFDKDSITSNKKLKDALGRFESGERDLLLGTQMLSKGHDYAAITLSVIMGLDYILGLADYRARERAMSLLVQIAGRSGRAREASVIIQSNNREMFLPYLEDYEAFLRDELEFVRDLYPPYVSLARILIAEKKQEKAEALTADIVEKLRYFDEVDIVGYGKAPVERIANKYRYTVLLRSKKKIPLLKALHSVNQRGIEIDMDPVEFS